MSVLLPLPANLVSFASSRALLCLLQSCPFKDLALSALEHPFLFLPSPFSMVFCERANDRTEIDFLPPLLLPSLSLSRTGHASYLPPPARGEQAIEKMYREGKKEDFESKLSEASSIRASE